MPKEKSYYRNLRDHLYTPNTNNIRISNLLENISKLSSRTLKSYQKHFIQRHLETSHNAPSNPPESPYKDSLLLRIIRILNSLSDDFDQLKEIFKKNIVITFSSFQDKEQLFNILMQPIYGLKYLLIGALYATISIIEAPYLIYFTLSQKNLNELNNALFLPAIKFLIIGLGLILTIPFTWFIQMPIRAFFNLIYQRWGRIEDGYHFQRLYTEIEQAIDSGIKLDCIISTTLLHRKFKLNLLYKERVTDIDIHKEQSLYNVVDKDFVLGTLNVYSKRPMTTLQKTHLLSYLSLFKADCYNTGSIFEKNMSY